MILCLAVWRLSKILVDEKGPYSIVERFRNRIINYPWSPIWCFKCTSVWVSFFFTMLLHLPLDRFILYWLAASAVAIFMRQHIEKDE